MLITVFSKETDVSVRAASALGVHRSTVYRWLSRGALSA